VEEGLKPFKIALSDLLMEGSPDVLRRGPDEPSEHELGSAEGTGQRIASEAGFEQGSPRVVDRAGGVVELIQKSIDEGEELAADALGQETVIADVAKIAVWNMSDEPSEEVQHGQTDDLSGVGIVVEIFKHDGLAVIGLDAGLSQGRTFEIFSEVVDRGFSVVGLFVEMDNPSLLIQEAEPTVKGCVGLEVPEAARELETTGFEFAA
jgi:hypothetical protein